MERQFTDSGKSGSTKMLKAKGFWKEHYVFFHHFSDASQSGYWQVSYVRMENENGDKHCCLIFGKSKVTTVKYVSIPRL